MSGKSPENESSEGSQSKEGEPSSMAVPAKPDVPEKHEDKQQLEAMIERLPPEQLSHTLRETLIAIIEKSATPRIDPELLKIAATTLEKDQDNKFNYLTQKEANAAAKSIRDDDFRATRHTDRFKVLRPCLFVALIVLPLCLFLGIYLAATGHEMLGACILTGLITSFLAYLGGLGTADLIKGTTKNK